MRRPKPQRNWAGNQVWTPQSVCLPASEAEVAAIVRDAARAGQRVKVVGARHSWSDILATDGITMSLDRMSRVVGGDGQTVRVQAGIRLHALNDELDARGLALPIVGSVTEQSVAGVISTGTHGSSLVHGNLATVVTGLRLVTGDGEVVSIDGDDPRLHAVRVGLGALGIITEVTLACVPAFRLCERTETISFDRAVAELPSIARSSEYVKLWWLPHTDSVIVFRAERTREVGGISAAAEWADRVVVNGGLFPVILASGRVLPALIPAANRLVATTYLKPRQRIGRSDKVLSLAMPPRHRETEYAIDVGAASEALAGLREVIAEQRVRVNFIQEVRFVSGDHSWLSPASGRETCQLGAYMAQAPGIDGFFGAFETRMKALGGRPHWGKEFSATPDELRAVYPRYDDFAALRRELDPAGVFRNGLIDRLFPE